MKKILYSQRLRLLWAAVCLTVGIGPILAVPTPKGKITVSGMVTDKNKQPLIGVTVIIKDTFSGTTTDNAGKYTSAATRGNIVIRKSSDKGHTWSSLTTLFKGDYHGAPTPFIEYQDAFGTPWEQPLPTAKWE